MNNFVGVMDAFYASLEKDASNYSKGEIEALIKGQKLFHVVEKQIIKFASAYGSKQEMIENFVFNMLNTSSMLELYRICSK